jgi:hypothetical protein
MLNLTRADFIYDPYPIGLIKPAFSEEEYKQMVETFPGNDLFMEFPKVGKKFVLSEKFHGEKYQKYIAKNPIWKRWYDYVKSTSFIHSVLDMLKRHSIDLGFKHYPVSLRRRLKTTWRDVRRGYWPYYEPNLRARFEFSMLSADGGCVTPHTDNAAKYITLVISMAKPGEWNPEFGGGTDVNKPKDITKIFNRLNDKLEFDEVDVLHTFPFEPNQAVIFIKTFNSWHSVRPMTGHGSPLMRRTLTINIEDDRL